MVHVKVVVLTCNVTIWCFLPASICSFLFYKQSVWIWTIWKFVHTFMFPSGWIRYNSGCPLTFHLVPWSGQIFNFPSTSVYDFPIKWHSHQPQCHCAWDSLAELLAWLSCYIKCLKLETWPLRMSTMRSWHRQSHIFLTISSRTLSVSYTWIARYSTSLCITFHLPLYVVFWLIKCK